MDVVDDAADPANVDAVDAADCPTKADDAAEEAQPSGHVDGNNAVPLKGSNGWACWPSVLQRYYATHTTSNHQCLHVHSNGICVLSVAPTHPAIQTPGQIASIAYRSHDAKNLTQTAVSGKRKHGAVFMTPRDMVCTLTLSDGSTVSLYACIRASVIEINQRLIDHPELLGTPAGCASACLPPSHGRPRTPGMRGCCCSADAACPACPR